MQSSSERAAPAPYDAMASLNATISCKASSNPTMHYRCRTDLGSGAMEDLSDGVGVLGIVTSLKVVDDCNDMVRVSGHVAGVTNTPTASLAVVAMALAFGGVELLHSTIVTRRNSGTRSTTAPRRSIPTSGTDGNRTCSHRNPSSCQAIANPFEPALMSGQTSSSTISATETYLFRVPGSAFVIRLRKEGHRLVTYSAMGDEQGTSGITLVCDRAKSSREDSDSDDHRALHAHSPDSRPAVEEH